MIQNNSKARLKAEVFPLYKEFDELNLPNEEELTKFYCQLGEEYSSEDGLMFIGKATNGWDEKEEEDFSIEKRMNWIPTYQGGFWPLIRKVCRKLYGEHWPKKFIYNNLYKYVPVDEGNPNAKVMKSTFNICNKILKLELEITAPKVAIFFTSGMEDPFLTDILGEDTFKTPNKIEMFPYQYRKETKLYPIKIYRTEHTTFVTCNHPQAKKLDALSNLLYNIIQEISQTAQP